MFKKRLWKDWLYKLLYSFSKRVTSNSLSFEEMVTPEVFAD